jgi:RNA polymerase sigma factor (sigma-70 family)
MMTEIRSRCPQCLKPIVTVKKKRIPLCRQCQRLAWRRANHHKVLESMRAHNERRPKKARAKPSFVSPLPQAEKGALILKWIPFACRYGRRFWRHGPGRRIGEREDCEQVAVEALLLAVERFDPARGLSFMTYAAFWLKKRLNQAANNGGLIRVPSRVLNNLRGVKDKPFADERLLIYGARAKYVNQLAPVPADGNADHSWEPIVWDRHDDETEELSGPVNRALARLPEPQRLVIQRIFGIGRAQPEPLRIIAADMGISHQAVSQRWHRALPRLVELLRQELPESVLMGK